jgi:hypothetical protein
LRKQLALSAPPVVLETHGGAGKVFDRVYYDCPRGIVFEVDAGKAEILCRQRPSWSVYQARTDVMLAEGAGAHLQVDLVDVDPYGEPWPVLEAFFRSERPRARRVGIAVNDGLRQKLRLQGGWSVNSMRGAVERWGNAVLHEKYLDVARWKVEQLAELQGYQVTGWTGYFCGYNDDMTHYAAVLERAQ